MKTKTDKINRINNNIFSVDVTDEDQTHNIRNTLIVFCCTYLVAKSVDASYLLDTNNQNLLQNSDKADSLSIPYPLVSPKFHLVDMSSLLRLLNRSEIMSK